MGGERGSGAGLSGLFALLLGYTLLWSGMLTIGKGSAARHVLGIVAKIDRSQALAYGISELLLGVGFVVAYSLGKQHIRGTRMATFATLLSAVLFGSLAIAIDRSSTIPLVRSVGLALSFLVGALISWLIDGIVREISAGGG